MHHNYLVFDIETAPTKRGLLYLSDVAPVKIDSRLKDPEKIKEAKERARKKMQDKAALYWWTGKIHTICATDLIANKKYTFQDLKSERNLLIEFLSFLHDHDNYILIGKSSDKFDIPYLTGRALAHDLGLVHQLRSGRPITDVDRIFGFKSDQQTTLDNYAFGLGLPLKPMSGAEVFKLCQDGESKIIADYCEHDVFITSELLRRYCKPFTVSDQSESVSVDGIF